MKSRIAFLVLIVLLVAGCSNLNSNNRKPAIGWDTGTRGVELNFMQGAPPSIMYHGETQSVTLEVWNRGVSSVPAGNIFFTGFDPGIINGLPPSRPISFTSGKNEYNPEGEYKTVDGSIRLNYRLPTILRTSIKATVMYVYSTQFGTDVCVDSEPLKPGDKPCIMALKTIGGGQGAPVSVTKVEPQAMTNKVRFKVTFRNSGNGEVINRNKINAVTVQSPQRLSPNDYDYVDIVRRPKLGNQEGECYPTTVKLVNKEGFTLCTFSVDPKMGAYSTRLDLLLDYGYLSSVEVPLSIKGPDQ